MTFKNRIHSGDYCWFDWLDFEKKFRPSVIKPIYILTPRLWAEGILISDVVLFLQEGYYDNSDQINCGYFRGLINNQTIDFMIDNETLEKAYDQCMFDLSKEDDRIAKLMLVLEMSGVDVI